eukprot:1528891-Pyramimonas_sp.AAC.1
MLDAMLPQGKHHDWSISIQSVETRFDAICGARCRDYSIARDDQWSASDPAHDLRHTAAHSETSPRAAHAASSPRRRRLAHVTLDVGSHATFYIYIYIYISPPRSYRGPVVTCCAGWGPG